MSGYKVYWWDGTSLDARWDLADTRQVALTMLHRRRLDGAACAVILGPEWQVIDSWSEHEGASLDDVLGRGRHGA